jgi:hypothetical protein
VYAGNSAGKWEFQELFSSSDLLERASQLARAGKVTEAEAILRYAPSCALCETTALPLDSALSFPV